MSHFLDMQTLLEFFKLIHLKALGGSDRSAMWQGTSGPLGRSMGSVELPEGQPWPQWGPREEKPPAALAYLSLGMLASWW